MTDTTTKPAEGKPAPKRKRAAAKPKTNGTAPKPRRQRGDEPTVYLVQLANTDGGESFKDIGTLPVPPNTRRSKVRQLAGEYVVREVPEPPTSNGWTIRTLPVRDVDTFPVRAVQTTIVEVGS